jgi:hypothetical protein
VVPLPAWDCAVSVPPTLFDEQFDDSEADAQSRRPRRPGAQQQSRESGQVARWHTDT